MKLNRTPNPLNRDARNKENENWDTIQQKFNDVVEEVSDKAFSKVIDGSKIDWEQMVDKVSDLPSNVETGETRGVKEDNKIYRFNGTDWIPIAEINLNPIAEVDQRLTTQLAQTSQDINAINDELETKRDKNEKITKSDYDLSQDANKWNINDFDEQTRQTFLEAQGIDVNYVLGKGAIIRENYADRSVYPEKTTFAKSKNLAGELVRGLSITGPIGEWEFTEAENAYTYVTRLEKGKTYAVWGE